MSIEIIIIWNYWKVSKKKNITRNNRKRCKKEINEFRSNFFLKMFNKYSTNDFTCHTLVTDKEHRYCSLFVSLKCNWILPVSHQFRGIFFSVGSAWLKYRNRK